MPYTTEVQISEWRSLWCQNPEATIEWLAGVFHCNWGTANKYVNGNISKGGHVTGFAHELTEPVDATPAEPVDNTTAEPVDDLTRFVRAFESRAIEWNNDKLTLESDNEKLRIEYAKVRVLNGQLETEVRQLNVVNNRLNADNTALALTIRNRAKLSPDVIANSPLLRPKQE